MKIEFEIAGNSEFPCRAFTKLSDGEYICTHEATWEKAIEAHRAKLAVLAAVPPPPEPIEI